MWFYAIVGIIIVLFFIFTVIFFLFQKRDLEAKIEKTVSQSLTEFQNRIGESLERTRTGIEHSKDEISKNALLTLESLKNMQGIITRMLKQQESVEKLGESLKYLLMSPKLRGNLGEHILEELLRSNIGGFMWETQYELSPGNRVDAVIKYRDFLIPIDSKFPFESYRMYKESENQQEKKEWFKKFISTLKREIDSISQKYIQPEKKTTDFALLFVPSEPVFSEIVDESSEPFKKSGIIEYAMKKKVFLTGPQTLFVFLKIILLGIKNIKLIENAKQIQNELVKIEVLLKHFDKKVLELGKHLSKAKDAYDIATSHYNSLKKRIEKTVQIVDIEDD